MAISADVFTKPAEMIRKIRFYERYGVEEYYIYDPDQGELSGWLRSGGELVEIPTMSGWVSPRLDVRFELHDQELQLYYPDGRRFAAYVELVEQAAKERRERELAQAKAARLAARLQALGIDPEEIE